MAYYHTLITREDGIWSPQFGDYDREVVAYEMDDFTEYQGYARQDVKIIRTKTDAQSEIDALIADLNVGVSQ